MSFLRIGSRTGIVFLSSILLAPLAPAHAQTPQSQTPPEPQPPSSAGLTLSDGSLYLNEPGGTRIRITQQPGAALQLNQQPDGVQLQCVPEAAAHAALAPTSPAPDSSPAAANPPPAPPAGAEAGTAAPEGKPQPPDKQAAGTAEPASARSESRTERSDQDGGLRNEVFGLTPELGALSFRDEGGSRETRGAAGVGLELNLMPGSPFFLGPATGVLFSRTGNADANFFGSMDQSGVSNPNLVSVPANLKLAWNPGGGFRIGLHGGGNWLHRSSGSTVALGAQPDGSSSKFLPDAGADLEIGLGSHVALSLQPDVVFAGNNALYTGTAGLLIPIG
jgi:hypothetical protein